MTQAMVKRQDPASELRGLLEKSKEQIRTAAAKHMTPERIARCAMTAFQKTPALFECSTRSILGCVIQASELGLELSGVLGHCYMVPYWNKHTKQKEAQFQIGYRGLIELALRNGRAVSIQARVVRARDEFSVACGSFPQIKHIPALDAPQGQDNPIVAVYACVQLRAGGHDFEVMSAVEIEAHRQKWCANDSVWDKSWEEMAKKTVIRRLVKRCPLSVEIGTAAGLDEMHEQGLPQQLTVDAAVPRLTSNQSVMSRVAEEEPAEIMSFDNGNETRAEKVSAKLAERTPRAVAVPGNDETAEEPAAKKRKKPEGKAEGPTPPQLAEILKVVGDLNMSGDELKGMLCDFDGKERIEQLTQAQAGEVLTILQGTYSQRQIDEVPEEDTSNLPGDEPADF